MKFFATLCTVLLYTSTVFAQSSTTELVFKNPVLVSGTAKKIGATYRFYNVKPGTDALLTIASASTEQQLVNNIDVTQFGWDKAFQPEIGKSGNVACLQEWWVGFNLKFVHANTSTKKTLDKFYATAIDVDGDNYVIQEFIQMYNPDSVTYRNPTKLLKSTAFNTGIAVNAKTNLSEGPISNYTNIDTNATKVMVTYTFLNTSEINFVYGATVGNGTSNAGLRLNSLWFKAFNLNSNAPLHVNNTDFHIAGGKKGNTLSWKSLPEDDCVGFKLERSTDGTNFKQIGEVLTKNLATDYTFTDENLPVSKGLIYYRIVFVEKTGEIKYSPIKFILMAGDSRNTIRTFPNPVKNQANFSLPLAWQNKPLQISLYSPAGTMMQSRSITSANAVETLQTQQLPAGIYLVRFKTSDGEVEQRFIKN